MKILFCLWLLDCVLLLKGRRRIQRREILEAHPFWAVGLNIAREEWKKKDSWVLISRQQALVCEENVYWISTEECISLGSIYFHPIWDSIWHTAEFNSSRQPVFQMQHEQGQKSWFKPKRDSKTAGKFRGLFVCLLATSPSAYCSLKY